MHVEGDATADLVAKLAEATGATKSEAVTAELAQLTPEKPLRERLAELRASRPLPPRTGKVADKAFFDELSGEPDIAQAGPAP